MKIYHENIFNSLAVSYFSFSVWSYQWCKAFYTQVHIINLVMRTVQFMRQKINAFLI